jgi:epoxyqueuosine reductase QueG
MIEEILRKNLIPANQFIFGFADLRGLLSEKYDGFHYGISIGKKLDDKIIDNIKIGPTLEYYNYYKRINTGLSELTEKIHSDLSKEGIDSLRINPTVLEGTEECSEEYLRTLTVDISHKMVATRAGLGWIGKSDLFVSRAFGPRLRLVSMLLHQKPDHLPVPVEKSECGKCMLCVTKCPAKAATGKLWNTAIHRDDFFNAHKCREKCAELAHKKFNIDVRICGICVSVCPIPLPVRSAF